MPTAEEKTAALDDYQWLVGAEADTWLKTTRSLVDEGLSLVQIANRLREQLPAIRVHLLLQQCELRSKARHKFPTAASMFFTPLGLQQATDAWVATYKAGRFPANRPVADLCCGIGGDLSALAQRGPVWGVDRDPIAALIAEANVRVVLDDEQAREFRVQAMEIDLTIQLPDVAAWHIDPDRRPSGRRTTRVELHEPGPEVLARLLSACPHAAIKLAPAATLDNSMWNNAELEWISRAGECRQLVAWFGELAEQRGHRRATVLKSPPLDVVSAAAASFFGEPNVECPTAARIGRYVFEPDPAVLAAKLEGALAVDQGLAAFTPGIAYFTGDRILTSPMICGFEVIEVMPYRQPALRQWLSQRGFGRVEIKKRGVAIEPEKVRQELRLAGDGIHEATILLARIAGRTMAIVARRQQSTGSR